MNSNPIAQRCVKDLKTIYNQYRGLRSSFATWCKNICEYKLLPDGTPTNIFWDDINRIPKNPDIELAKAMQISDSVRGQALIVILRAYFTYLSVCKVENKPPMPLDAWADLIMRLARDDGNEDLDKSYNAYNRIKQLEKEKERLTHEFYPAPTPKQDACILYD